MKRTIKPYFSLLICCILLSLKSVTVFSQNDTSVFLSNKIKQFQKEHFQERIFTHTDKKFYVAGETIWMKLYLVDALLHKPSRISKIVYVELVNQFNQSVLRTKIQMEDGFGDGSLKIANTFKTGNYTLRAYTQWMRNEGPTSFFEQQVPIVNTLNDAAKSAIFNLPAKLDFQFFPEGGNLLEGVENKVAFKALDEFEKGIDCTGVIVNSVNDTIVKFNTFKFGMGSFLFKPQKGENYKSFILQGGNKIAVALPTIQTAGFGMRLLNSMKDSLLIQIQTLGISKPEQLYLLVHGNQFSTNPIKTQVSNGYASFAISKNQLKEGVNRITIFNDQLKPVCERSYFKYPEKHLALGLNTSKNVYGRKSEVQLSLTSNHNELLGDIANVSMSVFLLDSIESNEVTPTIDSYLLLTKALNGYVQSPSFYFDSTKMSINERTNALDNLMLTQGWTSYTWQEILGPSKPSVYLPELEGPLVFANITDKKSLKPANNVLTYFSIPGKPFYFATAMSNSNGDLIFNLKTDLGAKEAIIQAQPNEAHSYHFSIIDPFDTRFSITNKKPFTLPVNLYTSLLSRSIASQVENIFENTDNGDLPSLNKMDTLPFYGKPTNSYYLDEYTRFTSMEELTREYVTEVKIKNKDNKWSFVLWNNRFQIYNEQPPTMLIDGVPIFDVNKLFAFDPLKIKNIDIVAQTNIKGSLFSNGIISYHTYKGDLANFPIDANALLLEYEGAQLNRKFYAPKYPNSNPSSKNYPDFRNVLVWQPSIKLQNQTPQNIQFYTSDIPGKYAILVQGVSNNGLLGSSIKYIVVQ